MVTISLQNELSRHPIGVYNGRVMNREHNISHFIKRDPIIPTIFAAAYRNKNINLEYRYVMRKKGGGWGGDIGNCYKKISKIFYRVDEGKTANILQYKCKARIFTELPVKHSNVLSYDNAEIRTKDMEVQSQLIMALPHYIAEKRTNQGSRRWPARPQVAHVHNDEHKCNFFNVKAI